MQFNYPFRINQNGRTATTTGDEDHIHQLIEQVLFTVQSERVNRPTFGTNVNQLVFAPNSDELATATQFLVQGALQQWLGDLIQIESVKTESEESTLRITIDYIIRRNQEHRTQTFSRQT